VQSGQAAKYDHQQYKIMEALQNYAFYLIFYSLLTVKLLHTPLAFSRTRIFRAVAVEKFDFLVKIVK